MAGSRRRNDLPLADYGIVGDGVTAALIATDGSVDWLCHGRFDGPAVFCRLLDFERGGFFRIAPATGFRSSQHYVGHTNVLVTDFECAAGAIRLTDFMPLARRDGSVLLRRLEGLAGELEIELDFFPTFDFARGASRVEATTEGCQACSSGDMLRLACPPPLTVRPDRATGTFRLAAGQTRWFALTHGATPPDPADAPRLLEATLEAWRAWSDQGEYAPAYEDVLRRTALLLKLLVHSSSGAVVAAPTTSLPEVIGGSRNWDYRFTWPRDASWVVSSLMDLGYHDESMAFIHWLGSLELEGDRPFVCYDPEGRPPSSEEELGHLRGYRGSRPVRVGNAASAQDQHDAFGEVIAAIHLCSDEMAAMRPLSPSLWQLVAHLAERALLHWEHPDRGLWEVRDRPRRFLSSALLCWVALDRALRIARRDGLDGPLDRWRAGRARIRSTILEIGFDPEVGAFTRAFGETDLDASALLLSRYGILPADDPRLIKTVDLVRHQLSAGEGLLYRYVAPDGLPGTEGAFTACSFWLVDCLARQGRVNEAHTVFERVVGYTSNLGLLSEQIDPHSRTLLGNYPQAFTHLALISAAVALAEAERGHAVERGP
jgi:GH15 family glucan-1,4-alpha-glucosidase